MKEGKDSVSKESGYVSVRDIATVVGCSPSSVSRTLRGHKRVGADLRERILSTAKALGYQPNPMVISLMRLQKNRQNLKDYQANIGWINSNPIYDFWHAFPYTKVYFDTAKQHAQKLGFGFEELWANEEGMTGRRLEEIALSRGVQGVVISGSDKVFMESGFNPDHFAAVCLRDDMPGQQKWHQVGTTGHKNAMRAFSQLRVYGHRRIGLIIGLSASEPEMSSATLRERIEQFNSNAVSEYSNLPLAMHKAILAGFHYAQQSVQPEERMKPFLFNISDPDRNRAIGNYMRYHQLDAVLCHNSTVVEGAAYADLKVPEDISIAHLNLGSDVPGWAGINQHPQLQAVAAMDFLSNLIQRNDRGIPPFPQFLSLEGEWQDGSTVLNRTGF